MSTASPTATPAKTDRRATRNARNPTPVAHRRMPSGTPASAPGGKQNDLDDDAGKHRDCDRACPYEELGFISNPPGGDKAEDAPHFTGKKADQHEQRIGIDFAHLRALRSQWMP